MKNHRLLAMDARPTMNALRDALRQNGCKGVEVSRESGEGMPVRFKATFETWVEFDAEAEFDPEKVYQALRPVRPSK